MQKKKNQRGRRSQEERFSKRCAKWISQFYLFILKFTLLFMFSGHAMWHVGSQVPGPGIERMLPAQGGQSLTHWTIREVSGSTVLICMLTALLTAPLCHHSDLDFESYPGYSRRRSQCGTRNSEWELREQSHEVNSYPVHSFLIDCSNAYSRHSMCLSLAWY